MWTVNARDDAPDLVVERRRCCFDDTADVHQNLNDPFVHAEVRWTI